MAISSTAARTLTGVLKVQPGRAACLREMHL